MTINEEVKELDKEILNLEIKKNDLISRYIDDNGLIRIYKNINNSGIFFDVVSDEYDYKKYMYIISLALHETDKKKKAELKDLLLKKAFKGIDDGFLIDHVRIEVI